MLGAFTAIPKEPKFCLPQKFQGSLRIMLRNHWYKLFTNLDAPLPCIIIAVAGLDFGIIDHTCRQPLRIVE
jgi:hypothetical protein